MEYGLRLFGRHRNYSRTVHNHIPPHEQVKTLLSGAVVTFELKTCVFLGETINYHSHIIRPSQLEVSDYIVNNVQYIKEPTAIDKIRSLFGLCNVSDRSSGAFFKIAAPFNQNMRKEQVEMFRLLTNQGKKETSDLKQVPTHTSVLTLTRAAEHYSVETDACGP